MIGDRYGRLVILKDLGMFGKYRRVECMCECGVVKSYRLGKLREGITRSCGCYRRELARANGTPTHGMWGTREYNSWHTMHQRCSCSKTPKFHIYGGKGISVCERWRTFEAFYADMGPRPPGHSLDRIDSNGNYEPSNCRWATYREQANNTKRNRFYTYQGTTLTEAQWSRKLGIPDTTLRWRVAHWGIDKAFSTPRAVVSDVFSEREIYP